MIRILIVIISILISFVCYLFYRSYHNTPRVAKCANCHQEFDFDYWKMGIDRMSSFRKCPHCGQVTDVMYHKKYK